MNDNRYQQRRGDDDTWIILDAVTGRIAEVGSRQASGLSEHDAQELVYALNAPRFPFAAEATS